MLKASLRSTLLISLAVLMLSFVPVTAGAVTTRLTTGPTDSFQPAIEGDKVVWLDGSTDPASLAKQSDVYLLTLGGVAQKLTTVKHAHAPAISAGKVVWEDLRNAAGGAGTANSDIFGYTLPAGPEAAVDTSPSSQLQPDTSGGRVVWADNRNGNWDVYLKDTDGLVYRITADPGSQTEPRIDGDLIVWTDGRNGTDDIYLYNIATAATTRITDNPAHQNGPDISGHRIVWTDWRSTRNTYVYDLDSPVANGTAVDPSPYVQYSARISGNRVVWTDWRNGSDTGNSNSDIYARNLSTGMTARITANANLQNMPDVSGDRVVWADNRNGQWDIYLDTPDTIAPTAAVKAPALASNQSKTTTFKVSWSGVDPAPSSGIVSYDVRYKIGAGGSWKTWKTGVASTSANLSGAGGKTYFFKARAKDGEGNVGSWSDEAKTIVPYDQGKRILRRRGFNGVFASAASNFYRGTVRYSTKRNDYMIYRFSGNSFSFISTKGKNRSRFKVIVDGANKGTFDSRASKTKYRQAVYSTALAGAGPHRVKIVNLATAGRNRLDIDGLAVGN